MTRRFDSHNNLSVSACPSLLTSCPVFMPPLVLVSDTAGYLACYAAYHKDHDKIPSGSLLRIERPEGYIPSHPSRSATDKQSVSVLPSYLTCIGWVIIGSFASTTEFGSELNAWYSKYRTRSVAVRLDSRPKEAIAQALKSWTAPGAPPLVLPEGKGGLAVPDTEKGCCTAATAAQIKLIMKEPVASGLFDTPKFVSMG